MWLRALTEVEGACVAWEDPPEPKQTPPACPGLGEAVGWALQPAPTGRRKVRKAQAIRGLR